MSFAESQKENRRLLLLKMMREASGYRANETLLVAGLHGYGHMDSVDLVRTELAWLAEQSLIELTEIGGLQIANITMRGRDVSLGLSVAPGVEQPGPE